MINSQNKLLIDWVSITIPFMDPINIIEYLGLSDVEFADSFGMHGYRFRLYYDGISIHYGGSEEKQPGIWLEMSGQGCRNFESYGSGNFEVLFDLVLDNPECNLTRLDIAYDVFDNPNLLENIINYAQAGNLITKFRTGEVESGILSNKGKSVYFGSRKSDILLRVYDKKEERNREDIKSWIRLELQLKDDNAKSFISSSGSINHNFFSLLNNYIRFVEPSETDSNKRRWSTCTWWTNIIDSSDKLQLLKPGKEYNDLILRHYVVEQSGQATKTFIKKFGVEALIRELNEHRFTPNIKYQSLGVNVNEKI